MCGWVFAFGLLGILLLLESSAAMAPLLLDALGLLACYGQYR